MTQHELLHQHGYAFVLAAVLVEQVGVPIPAFAVLVIAGAFAANGAISAPLVLAPPAHRRRAQIAAAVLMVAAITVLLSTEFDKEWVRRVFARWVLGQAIRVPRRFSAMPPPPAPPPPGLPPPESFDTAAPAEE